MMHEERENNSVNFIEIDMYDPTNYILNIITAQQLQVCCQREREDSFVCAITIKCNFHLHPHDLIDFRIKHFKQKLTPHRWNIHITAGVLWLYNIRSE